MTFGAGRASDAGSNTTASTWMTLAVRDHTTRVATDTAFAPVSGCASPVSTVSTGPALPQHFMTDGENDAVLAERLGLQPALLEFFGLMPQQLLDLERVGDKPGGSRDASLDNGVYRNAYGEKMLLKSGQGVPGMREFCNSVGARSLIPDGVQVVPLNRNGNTYLVSVFIADSTDLYKAAFRAAGLPEPQKRPIVHVGNARSTQAVDDMFRRLGRDPGLQRGLAYALLTGNYDVHSGNFMVKEHGDRWSAHPIDHGWGSCDIYKAGVMVASHFGPELHAESMLRRAPMVGPTNHYRDIPSEVRSSPEHIDALLEAATHDFRPAFALALAQAAQTWSPEVFEGFAREAGLVLPRNQARTAEGVLDAYMERIGQRQESMKRYAAGLALGLFQLESDGQGNSFLVSQDGADGQALISRYLRRPELNPYFSAYVAGQGNMPKLRSAQLKPYEDIIRAQVAELMESHPLASMPPLGRR